ncbi:MAG TPA: putative toxin-antitoxin system toxin component, PIN family [Chitinophagales bacterium]|nr:putative toxin-antitoxin system toxin component, PIN family [Chitinophagales bacterium]
MRVVLDTNALLVSVPTRSDFRLVIDSFADKKYELLVTNEILSEYAEVLELKNGIFVAGNVVDFILHRKNLIRIQIYYRWNLIHTDQDDNKFSDCAIAGNADFLVSNDSHFRILRSISFPKVNVITVEEFLGILKTL